MSDKRRVELTDEQHALLAEYNDAVLNEMQIAHVLQQASERSNRARQAWYAALARAVDSKPGGV